MQIAEMRSALEKDYRENRETRQFGELPTLPTWAVRRIYEKRNGLSLTPLPAGMEARSLRSILATSQRSSAVTRPVVTDDDPNGEKEKIRLRLEALKLL